MHSVTLRDRATDASRRVRSGAVGLMLAALGLLLAGPTWGQDEAIDWPEPGSSADEGASHYLFLESSFGAFWPNEPSYELTGAASPAESQLAIDTGLYSKRALGFVFDQDKRAYSLALSYASGEDELAKNRYRLDSLGVELGYRRDLFDGIGVSGAVGLAAARTMLKIEGSAFEDAWSPIVSASTGIYYDLSEWRSIGVDLRAEVLPATQHDWPIMGNDIESAKLGARVHSQVAFSIRRRF